MIETFFLKNIRYFTKSLNILHVSTKNREGGEASYIFHHKNIYRHSTWSFLLCDYDYLTREGRRLEVQTDYQRHPRSRSRQATSHFSSNTLRKRPWRESRKSKGKIMVFLLVILVTGNRKRRQGGPGARLHVSFPSVTTMWPRAGVFQKENPCGWCVSVLSLARFITCRYMVGGDTEAGSQHLPRGVRTGVPGVSVRPVLPLFVLFILLFVGTLGTEPLHLFWGCGHYSDAGPAWLPRKKRLQTNKLYLSTPSFPVSLKNFKSLNNVLSLWCIYQKSKSHSSDGCCATAGRVGDHLTQSPSPGPAGEIN